LVYERKTGGALQRLERLKVEEIVGARS